MKRYRTLILALMLMFFISIGMIYLQINKVERFEVFIDNTYMGTISQPDVIEDWLNSKEQSLSSQYPEAVMKVDVGEISYKPKKMSGNNVDDRLVISELEKRAVSVASGVEVTIDGKNIAIVRDNEIAQKILDEIKSKYQPNGSEENMVQTLSAKENGDMTGKQQMESLEFVQEVTLKEKLTTPRQITSMEEILSILQTGGVEKVNYTVQAGDCVSCISKKLNVSLDLIYKNNAWIENDFISVGDELDLTELKPMLSVKSVEKRTDTLVIPRGIKYENDPSMRLGQSRVLQEGKDGAKQVTYLITKINGEIIEETPDNEILLEASADKIIIQGTKIIPGIGTGNFAWPIVSPTLTSEFGKRWGKLHAGTDAVSSNRAILASDHGKVVYASTKSGYGQCIIIDHQNGYRTLYAHLSDIQVKDGQKVEKGEKIGVMGSTGNSTGVHLHFEIQKDGIQQNPLKFLNR
ncbi:LysM peptidoglycan-binding domain-containing M23 family metallopeptidase [Paenibacillus alginolyticus]|uniref:Peptidoglycan DD-metalloendopeptidase family protein n=1 Tax=Paenibacillus alginolyticus TaxID=59839 RepID=A0ABT4GJ57_9BACL|nr:M23 family metallopeptidase [Paenibacillus alginolyticus]MCY9696156.1 peptidoglycan DD-metalloendopeptidase family protein [Paenibacillus alginolyticus]MEC0143309.1 peptidoglycan DD-metalloendopeptidase family protein [Paenibacillus alginolyticus]